MVTTDLVDTRDELAASGGAVIVKQDGGSVAIGVRELLARRADRGARMQAARERVFRELDPSVVSAQFEAMYAQAASTSHR